MSNPSRRMFCPSCQAEVEAIQTPGPGGAKVAKCSVCGTTLSRGAGPAEPSVSLDEVSFVDETISIPNMESILVVGYTPGARQLLVDMVSERHLAREVLPMQNGEEMIINIISRLTGTSSHKIDLILSDVPMPFLNGINAAIGLRAIERSYQSHDLIPILFLTNKPCDDTFKKVIRFLAPAKYATLGPVDNREALVKHLSRVINLVSQEKW